MMIRLVEPSQHRQLGSAIGRGDKCLSQDRGGGGRVLKRRTSFVCTGGVALDFRQVLLSQHARTHSTMIGPTDLPLEDMVLSELSDEQIRLRPHAGSNSIAWLLWHMARCEDVAVNLIVAERLQVVDETDWPRRLNVARRDIGTGMTDDEVNALSANVDIAALRAYRAQVGRRTQEGIRSLPLEELQTPMDATLMASVICRGCVWVKHWLDGGLLDRKTQGALPLFHRGWP